jgi:hypothetical protein
MTRNKRAIAISENRCPIQRMPECFDFPPIPRTPEEAGMTQEQVADLEISRGRQLYWCSECTWLWYREEYNYLRMIGTQRTYGAPFIPNKNKSEKVYVGD